MPRLSPALRSLLPTVLCAQEPTPAPLDRSGCGWEFVQLDLDVRLYPEDGILESSGTAWIRLTRERSAGPTLSVRYTDFEEITCAEGTVRLGARHPALPDVRLATIELDTPAQRGDVVEVEFSTVLRKRTGQLLVDPEVAIASWTQAWYPFPLPAPGEGFTSGHAAVPGVTRFSLPSGWRVLSDGVLLERLENESGTEETWELDEPLARSFAAAAYQVGRQHVEGRDVAVYLLGRDAESAAQQAASLAAAIRAMEPGYGDFPFATYGIAEIPKGKGGFYGASQQSFLMADAVAFRFGANLPLFAHEAAHAWWGNAVGTRGPGDLLCSESLAQYGAVLAIEGIEGKAAATEFLRFSRRGYISQQCARGYFGMLRRGQDVPLSELVASNGVHHDLSDAKGHWVYHMLRRRIGDERFFATLQGILREYRGRSVSLEEVRAAFVAAAPDAGLETFFTQWLDRTGAPELQAEWRSDAEGVLDLVLRQKQPGEAYDLFVEVAVIGTDGELSRHELHLQRKEQRFELPVDDRVTAVEVDLDHRLLLWHPDYGPSPYGEDPELRAEDLARYSGHYDLGGGRSVEVLARDGRLEAQLGSRTMRLRALGDHRFAVPTGTIEFQVGDDGIVQGIEFTSPEGERQTGTRR